MGLTQAFVPSIVQDNKSNDDEEEQMDTLNPLVQEVFGDQILISLEMANLTSIFFENQLQDAIQALK